MIVRATVTVTGLPTDGVMITVAEYVPAVKPATFTVNVISVDCPASSLPLVGETVSQVSEGIPAVQFNVFPPRF